MRGSRLPGEPTLQERVLVALGRSPSGLTPEELHSRLRVPSRELRWALEKLLGKQLVFRFSAGDTQRSECHYFLVELDTEAQPPQPTVIVPAAVCPRCGGSKDPTWVAEAVCGRCFKRAVTKPAHRPSQQGRPGDISVPVEDEAIQPPQPHQRAARPLEEPFDV